MSEINIRRRHGLTLREARRLAEGLPWEQTAEATERHLRDIIEGSAQG